MRVLLKHVRSGKYLGRGGIWTEDQKDAYDFGSASEAIKVWSVGRDDSIQMVYAFGASKFNKAIPLGVSDAGTIPESAKVTGQVTFSLIKDPQKDWAGNSPEQRTP